MNDPTNIMSVHVTPDPQAGDAVPVPDYIYTNIDYVNGFPMTLLTTGSCPENSLGDTTLSPVEIVDYANG